MDPKELGTKGEAIAAKYLINNGLEFVEKNIHTQGGEIDLLFKEPGRNFYILVEVKTRTNDKFGDAKESITRAKLQKILSAGYDYFTKQKGLDVPHPFRIDGIFLRWHKGKIYCEHIENIGFSDLH